MIGNIVGSARIVKKHAGITEIHGRAQRGSDAALRGEPHQQQGIDAARPEQGVERGLMKGAEPGFVNDGFLRGRAHRGNDLGACFAFHEEATKRSGCADRLVVFPAERVEVREIRGIALARVENEDARVARGGQRARCSGQSGEQAIDGQALHARASLRQHEVRLEVDAGKRGARGVEPDRTSVFAREKNGLHGMPRGAGMGSALFASDCFSPKQNIRTLADCLKTTKTGSGSLNPCQ